MMGRSKLISLMIIISTFMLLSTVTVSAKTISEHESNDEYSKSNTINVGDKVYGQLGTRYSSDNGYSRIDRDDYFVFTAPESGYIKLNAVVYESDFESDQIGVGTIFDVRNNAGKRIGWNATYEVYPKKNIPVKFYVRCGKKYYVKVYTTISMDCKYYFKIDYTIDKTKITKVKAKKTSAKVTWKKKNEASYYQIRYASPSSYSRFGWTKGKTIKASRNTSSKTITKLKKKHSYYVTVRVVRVVQGKTYYSGWSGKKLIKTKRK